MITLLPAPINTGIVFIPEGEAIEYGIKAHFESLRDTHNAITIGSNGFDVRTIEHFMATFYALDITNLYVMVGGHEMPEQVRARLGHGLHILDGHSLFKGPTRITIPLRRISSVGIVEPRIGIKSYEALLILQFL